MGELVGQRVAALAVGGVPQGVVHEDGALRGHVHTVEHHAPLGAEPLGELGDAQHENRDLPIGHGGHVPQDARERALQRAQDVHAAADAAPAGGLGHPQHEVVGPLDVAGLGHRLAACQGRQRAGGLGGHRPRTAGGVGEVAAGEREVPAAVGGYAEQVNGLGGLRRVAGGRPANAASRRPGCRPAARTCPTSTAGRGTRRRRSSGRGSSLPRSAARVARRRASQVRRRSRALAAPAPAGRAQRSGRSVVACVPRWAAACAGPRAGRLRGRRASRPGGTRRSGRAPQGGRARQPSSSTAQSPKVAWPGIRSGR